MSKGGKGSPATPQAALRDGQLIRGVRNGNKDCQAEFYELFRVQVASILFRFLGNDEFLADLVQSVFVTCYRRAGEYRLESGMTVWIYRACMDVLVEHESGAKKKRSAELRSSVAHIDEPGAQIRVRQLFSMLALPRRIVFFLHEVEGLPVKEISLVVGSSSLVVRGRLFAAKRDFYRFAGQVFS